MLSTIRGRTVAVWLCGRLHTRVDVEYSGTRVGNGQRTRGRRPADIQAAVTLQPPSPTAAAASRPISSPHRHRRVDREVRAASMLSLHPAAGRAGSNRSERSSRGTGRRGFVRCRRWSDPRAGSSSRSGARRRGRCGADDAAAVLRACARPTCRCELPHTCLTVLLLLCLRAACRAASLACI